MLLGLIGARARRGRWLLPAIGIAVAVAFGTAIVADGTIAGDRAARAVLAAQSPPARAVRVTWSGPATPAVAREARTVLRGLGPAVVGNGITEVLLLSPVRLGGVLVRPAAIAPLRRWVGAGGELRSAVPLGFLPGPGGPPVELTGDLPALAGRAELSSVYRTTSWVAVLDPSRLRAWQLDGVAGRLSRAQSALTVAGDGFSFTAPFDAIAAARAAATAGPARLRLLAGSAAALLVMFVVLVATGLRADQRAELERLLAAGATLGQCVAFVVLESAAIALVAVLAGWAVGAGAGLVLAGGDAGTVSRSVLTGGAAIGVAGAFGVAVAVLSLPVAIPVTRLADALAAVAVAGTVAIGAGASGSSGTTSLLLVPLACLAAAVVVARAGAIALRALERAGRRAPPSVRLALVTLARAPTAPALAAAFVTVSVGITGFALAYRATLERSAADQAAQQVPLDLTVSAGADFARPLVLAPLASWSNAAGGAVLPVRRTDASYLDGSSSVTVPALGIPAAGLPRIRGWRAADGSAPLAVLARRLRPPGAVRGREVSLPDAGGTLSVRITSPGLAVSVVADLLGTGDALRQVPLGTALGRAAVLRGRTPPGAWDLAGLELDEPTGLAATNGHQAAESPAGAPSGSARLSIGAIRLADRAGRMRALVDVRGWRGVGAASAARPGAGGAALSVRFDETGSPGLVRPPEPADRRPLPVLTDPATAAVAGRGGALGMTVDGLPVRAIVVGVLRRFPTVPSGSSGFVVADQATLAAALDAQLPGQGQADELWIATRRPARLRAWLGEAGRGVLGVAWRAPIERGLRTAPVARAVLGTLAATAWTLGGATVLGFLVALLGAGRDARVERDLAEQGVGPGQLRRQLLLRVSIVAAGGALAGGVLGVVVARLAVAAVRAAGAVAAPDPPLVTVVPAAAFVAVVAGAALALPAAGWIVARVAVR